MLEILSPLRGITLLSVFCRVLLAVICGGLIGIEREYKCRPAGFRTHILICLGAAMTTMTSQYLVLCMHYFTDMARLGAQVIAGIGFIGAGTIIVTRRKRVKGLTTAAGLWVAAVVGVACGAGYYESAVVATALVLLAEMVFSKWEYHILRNLQDVNLYIEYTEAIPLSEIIRYFHKSSIKIMDLEITRSNDGEKPHVCAVFELRLGKKTNYEKVLGDISMMEGVEAVEEI